MEAAPLKEGDIVFIVRYALTRGVIKLTVGKENLHPTDSTAVYAHGFYFRPNKSTVANRYYRNQADAMICAEEMREAKAERLNAQMIKLRGKRIKLIDSERF